MKRVYLDYAAATPLDSEVKAAMDKVDKLFANPSAPYASGRAAREQLQAARKKVAMFLGANQDEVVFTAGATEANNLAIFGVAGRHPKGRIISLATEHASVREPLQQLAQAGYDVQLCAVDQYGLIDMEDLARLLTPTTILVSLAYASGEIGTIQPLAKTVRLVCDFEASHHCQIMVHTDASAAALLLPCDVARLGVDLLTLSANKLYGPAGVGSLYVRRGVELKPLLYGGTQEYGRRAGTESVELAVGLAQAVQLVGERHKADGERFNQLLSEFMAALNKQGHATQLGHPKQRLTNIVSLSFDGVNGEDLVAYMDAAGFEIATGAACEAAKAEPSPALLALGLSPAQAQGSIRISVGRDTTSAEIRAAARALIRTLDKLKPTNTV